MGRDCGSDTPTISDQDTTVPGSQYANLTKPPIERRGRDAEAVRDLRHADVGIGEHRLGALDVVVRQFRRSASGAANAARDGEAITLDEVERIRI